MSKFRVVQIPMPDDELSSEKAVSGMIDKYWQDLPHLGQSLVKVDLAGAWAEKITETLAKLIGLPVARCELAERADGLKMIASPNYLDPRATEISGEKLLKDTFGERYKYSSSVILSALDTAKIELPTGFTPNATITKGADLMVGYLIFDSWTANIDRHSQNWGVQKLLCGRNELLPTYDHGMSLGMIEIVIGDELPTDVAKYSSNVNSSIKGDQIGRTLNMDALANTLLELRPEAANFWISEISKIDRVAIESVFDLLPEGWAVKASADFAANLLQVSGKRLGKIAQNQIPPPNK